MTKTLTDKWRAGNLKKSFYYLKFPDTETAEIYNLYDMEKFRYVQDSDKIDVLDEVPSYDEYIELATKCSQLSKISEQLKEANDIIKSFYWKDRGQAYLDKWGVK